MTRTDGEQHQWRLEGDAAATQRIDKWLWFARVVKSRTLAAELVSQGKVRINRTRAAKPSQTVRAGDVLTLALRGRIHVLKVLAPGDRRGPPPQARRLYEDLSPAITQTPVPGAGMGQRQPGAGRPTKRDRRFIERLTKQD
jgi:ribosome-associated heat shock protein Hsp15